MKRLDGQPKTGHGGRPADKEFGSEDFHNIPIRKSVYTRFRGHAIREGISSTLALKKMLDDLKID